MQKLTIIFPAYNDNAVLERALYGLQEQTYKNFKVVILDDVSPSDYSEIAARFQSVLDIQVLRNAHNFGAMNNIWQSIQFAVDTPYVMSHHTDDFLKSDYIARAIALLDQQEDLSFVLTGPEWVPLDTPYRKEITHTNAYSTFDAPDFAHNILHFAPYMFGSVIYRTSHRIHDWAFERFNTYCDRFFLGSILATHNSRGAFLEGRGIFERSHAQDKHDTRSVGATETHALALLMFYRDLLLKKYSKKAVSVIITNNTLFYYSNFNKRTSLRTFLQRQKEHGGPYLFKIIYIRTLGFFSLASMVFPPSAKRQVVQILRKMIRF